MKRLFIVDAKDYDESWQRSKRTTVRAIIECDGKLAMIHKKKRDYYAFPGGGIEDGESYQEALIREVKEETGLSVIPESIKEFGSVLRLNNSHRYENTIFEQENFYYKCKAYDFVEEQMLDDGEKEENFVLEFISPEDALAKNRCGNHGDENGGIWIERESKILEILIAEKEE